MAVLTSYGPKLSAAPGQTNHKADLKFARSAFTALANGDTKAAVGVLDWKNLKAGSVNVGAQYSALPNDAAKAGFRTGFIISFSKSFQGTGAKVASLTNWRVRSADATKVIVTADTPSHKTLLITVSKTGGQRKIFAFSVN